MKLLLTGAATYTEAQLNILRDMGHDVLFVQDERIPLVEQGIDPADIEATVCNGLFLYNDFSAFKNLRYVQLTSAGYDRVPLESMQEKGITVHNARGVYSAPMAEFAVCGVLQLYKQSAIFAENQCAHRWEKVRSLRELSGKTVCIVGCGSVGQACAKRFSAFDCRVLGVDVVAIDAPFFDKVFLLEELNAVLSLSDVIVLTVPLTSQTEGLFDAGRLACCKPDAVIVNITRGKVVVEQDLITALLERRFGGAVLDVFETEPLESDSPLWDMRNVIVTPHNSFVSDGNGERLFAVIQKNLEYEGAV